MPNRDGLPSKCTIAAVSAPISTEYPITSCFWVTTGPATYAFSAICLTRTQNVSLFTKRSDVRHRQSHVFRAKYKRKEWSQ